MRLILNRLSPLRTRLNFIVLHLVKFPLYPQTPNLYVYNITRQHGLLMPFPETPFGKVDKIIGGSALHMLPMLQRIW